MSAEVSTYEQDRPKDWLEKHPNERWRCDILTTNRGDHHGVGATEAEAMLNASTHYFVSSRKSN